MLRVRACLNPKPETPPPSFKDQYKAQVKSLVQKIQKRHMEQFQQYRATKSLIREDIKDFQLETLKIFSNKLSDFIASKEQDEKAPKQEDEPT
jgi:6-phosphofructokinase